MLVPFTALVQVFFPQRELLKYFADLFILENELFYNRTIIAEINIISVGPRSEVLYYGAVLYRGAEIAVI